jgi:hypothetical protein
MRKPNRATQQKSKGEKLAQNAFVVVAFGALVTALFLLITNEIERSRAKSNEEAATFADDPHIYSFTMNGRQISGESSNRFEMAQGYQARIEFCEKNGIENILVAVSCYFTIRPTGNLTISNSENPTTAVYENGDVATICCMHIDGAPAMPLYGIRLPRGSVTRRTYRRGDEVHILLNIPDADPGRNLDAISFSPGERAPAVSFPIRGNLASRVFSSEFVNARRNDPRMQEIIRDTIQLRDELRLRAIQNEGLTYPQEVNGIR